MLQKMKMLSDDRFVHLHRKGVHESFLSCKVALEAEEAHAEELREAKSRYVLYYNSQFNLNFLSPPNVT